LPEDAGVIVSDVRPGLSADKAGIESQDLIAAADGQPVQSAVQFLTLIYRRKPGDGVALRLLRGKKVINVNVVVVEKASNANPLSQAVDVDKNLISILDIVGLDVDAKLAETLMGIRLRSGVLVTAKCAKREGTDTSLKVG